eukprot:gene4305-4874_t
MQYNPNKAREVGQKILTDMTGKGYLRLDKWRQSPSCLVVVSRDFVENISSSGEGGVSPSCIQRLDAKFQECANVFNDESSTKDQVRAAGEKALIALYNGEENASLDKLRYNVFCPKLVSAKFQIKPEALPPTSATAKYHSMRVYWQTGCTNMRCTCKKNGLSHTTACGECGKMSCENAMHLDDSMLSDEE